MTDQQSLGHRAVLREWRAGISVSDLFPGRLVIVDRHDARCDVCGRPIACGDEARRGAGVAVLHVACAETLAGPKGQ